MNPLFLKEQFGLSLPSRTTWSLTCCHCFKFSDFGENKNRKSAE